jgi:CBS domain-containing protein
MKVSDVMTRAVEFVEPGATLQEAATAMAEHDVGAVLVGSAERLEGILTERDILLRAVTEGRNPVETTTAEVMSATLFTCGPDQPLAAAAALMDERQVRRLPVVDDAGRVVGIVVQRDLERALASAPPPAAPATTGAAETEASPH